MRSRIKVLSGLLRGSLLRYLGLVLGFGKGGHELREDGSRATRILFRGGVGKRIQPGGLETGPQHTRIEWHRCHRGRGPLERWRRMSSQGYSRYINLVHFPLMAGEEGSMFRISGAPIISTIKTFLPSYSLETSQ